MCFIFHTVIISASLSSLSIIQPSPAAWQQPHCAGGSHVSQLLSPPGAGVRGTGGEELGRRRGRLSTMEIGDALRLGKVEKNRLIDTHDLHFAAVCVLPWWERCVFAKQEEQSGPSGSAPESTRKSWLMLECYCRESGSLWEGLSLRCSTESKTVV